MKVLLESLFSVEELSKIPSEDEKVSKELRLLAQEYLDNFNITKPIANSLAKLDKLGLIARVEGGVGRGSLFPFSVRLTSGRYITVLPMMKQYCLIQT